MADYEQIVKNVAERALDEILYDGKSIREWMKIIIEQATCEDCIGRQEVLDYIDQMPSELTTDGRRMIRRRTLEEYISDAMPSVKPEKRTGHWIDREIYDADRWKCSVCGRTEQYQENYCPNCGCRMSEVSE